MLDIQAELHDAGQAYQDLYDAVVDLKRRHDLHPCAVRARDGLSLRSDGERETIQELVSRFRRLPEDTRRKLPALWNSLAQLEVVIGDLEAGLADFQEVARLVNDPISRAEAHHNVHRAALERRDWDTALAALRRAVALDPETFEPFPFARYEPRQILGAGGLGVSFLCQNRSRDNQLVVVKTLRVDGLDRDGSELLRDARVIQELDHPAFVRILGMGLQGTDPAQPETPPSSGPAIPYLVLEYVEGETLVDLVVREGPLSHEQWLDIAWPIARALQALHNRGLLHRSLRPSAILVRRTKNRDGASRFVVKLLDTGLALERAVIHASASNPESRRHSGLGRSVARLIPFAPPEIVSRPKGQVWVGPHSDVYSFGRLCAYGLTGQPEPDAADRLLLPEAWQKLLDDCVSWTINRRPAHLGLVIDQLSRMPGADERINRIERDLHEASIAGLTMAIEEAPSGELYVQRAGAYFRQGDYVRAIADYTSALERTPEDANLYRRRAQAHSRNNDHEGAIADYTEALRLEPRHLEALVNRGLAHGQKGDHERAIADFTEGLRLNHRDEVLYYNRANAYYCKGDFAQAIEDYTQTLRLDPRNLWALGNRGKAYLIEDQPARAVADFTRLLQLDPNNVKALCDRASAHLELGRHERAIADYGEAIRLDPSAGLYHDRGLARATAGELAQAIADFTEALTLSPDNAAVLISRGKAHADLGQHEQAVADFTESLRIAPEGTSALHQRATVLARIGRHDEAIADLTAAIALAPASPGGYFQRGNLYAEHDDHDQAIADFTEVLRINPRVAAAFTNRANSHSRLGEYEQALADYEQALALEPDDPLTLINRASAHLRLGHDDRALADYTEALRLDPGNGRTYSSRGLLLSSLGETDRALADFDSAIRLEPGNPRPYNHRGNVHAERGDMARAIADFSEAVRLDPEYALAWYNRGIAHAERKEYEHAISDFGEMLKRDPGHAGTLVNRGIARRRIGDRDGALADFTAAIAAEPDFLSALYNRASLLAERGEFDEARADLDRVVELAPDDVGARISRGRMHSARGRHDLALADNEAAFEQAPEDARVLNNLAWLLATAPQAELRDPPRALDLATRALVLDEDANRLDTLAAALAACGRFAEAIERQVRARELAAEEEKEDFSSRLTLYEAGQPFVQPGPGPTLPQERLPTNESPDASAG